MSDIIKEEATNMPEVTEMRFIKPSKAVFVLSEGKILSLKIGEELYPRVYLHQSFPFSAPSSYISVRDVDNKEICIIKDLNEWDKDVTKLLREQMNIRRFMPIIERINIIKQEFAHTYWDTDTNCGNCKFSVRNGNQNIVPVSQNELMVVDVEGNRYMISDLSALSDRECRLIEMSM